MTLAGGQFARLDPKRKGTGLDCWGPVFGLSFAGRSTTGIDPAEVIALDEDPLIQLAETASAVNL